MTYAMVSFLSIALLLTLYALVQQPTAAADNLARVRIAETRSNDQATLIVVLQSQLHATATAMRPRP